MANFAALKPVYHTTKGTPIYRVEAVHKRLRRLSLNQWPASRSVYLITHFTESGNKDSRNYLLNPGDGRVVSAHYLAGQYADMNNGQPSIIKYAGEADEATYTQGFGIIGDLADYDHGTDWSDGKVLVAVKVNANDACIGYEIDANPTASGMPSPSLLNAVTAHMADIIRYWAARKVEVVLLGHKHIDPHKNDPELDWVMFDKMVKAQV
jgi:N-acetyl-anhydromuramyl-L-alanine amidase AmpD